MGLKISIRTVSHDRQRYNTVGDYFLGPDEWIMIQVSELGDWKKEILIAVHELIEYLLVLNKGISIREIDAFDIKFDGDGEPGDDLQSPYHKEHIYATMVEKDLASELGIDWNEYEKSINKLFNKEER
jgi:hypothetical protein